MVLFRECYLRNLPSDDPKKALGIRRYLMVNVLFMIFFIFTNANYCVTFCLIPRLRNIFKIGTVSKKRTEKTETTIMSFLSNIYQNRN